MGIVHHTEGYVKMQSDKVYTLCLGYNDMGENSQFYPIGLLYGKIPHDEMCIRDRYDGAQTVECRVRHRAKTGAQSTFHSLRPLSDVS